MARGLAVADIDQDGDLDALITENNGPAHLWRNDNSKNAYLRIKLEGTQSNRDALGARVLAIVNKLTMERMVKSGASYASQSEKTLTLGLGQASEISSLEVVWPSGLVERFQNVSANQEVFLIEGSGKLQPRLPAPNARSPQ